jgi:stage III sporulation protein AG
MEWKQKVEYMIEKWKQSKKIPVKNQIVILLLLGILLVVITIPTGSTKDEAETKGESVLVQSTVDTTSESYETYLEERVARALEYVDGAGKVEVLLTLKNTGEKIVEKDTQSSSQKTQEEDSSGGSRTVQDNSNDRTSIYERASDGSQTPYVTQEICPEIEGVVVIAQGGDNAVVVQNITEAIQALFGVDAHKIKIMKRTDTY